MGLRTLLSITHSAVVVLFAGVFVAVFFSLSQPPEPPGSPQQSAALARLIDARSSDLDYLAYFQEFHLDVASIDLFDSQGKQRRILGSAEKLYYPQFGGAVAAGAVFLEFRALPGDVVQWMPLRLADGQIYVLRIMAKRSFSPWFAQVVRNLSVSLAIALAFVLSLAWAIARRMARPVRELANVTDRFGRESLGLRAAPEGPREFAELAGSFNRMAEYLQSTILELQDQREEALQAEKSRRQFLADVSHNLRTPLAAVLGWNDTLLEGGLSADEDPSLYLRRMRREILHVARIVGRLLELSRWEKAGPTLRKEVVLVADLLLEVAENLQDSALEADVELCFEGLETRLELFADQAKARDIFQILLENVVAHAGRRTKAIIRIVPERESVRFTVLDNGVGYPANLLRGDVDRGGDDHGRVCLGLSIASRLIAAHGGVLLLTNGRFGGAQASFCLPRFRRDDP